jgi:predicted O-methyltransferase YrrM
MNRKLNITKADLMLIAIATFVIVAFTAIGWWWLGEVILVGSIGLLTMVVLLFCLETYRRINYYILLTTKDTNGRVENLLAQQTDFLMRQLESLLSLYVVLKPKAPLPNTRGWAASPDLLKKISEIIYTEKPSLVVEIGSGVSTLIIAYCLQHIGKGRLISLEHKSEFVDINHELLKLNGLDDIAQVIHAPLQPIELGNEKWVWYDISSLKLDQPIDFLFVDGPPGESCKLARYPALPVLFEHLNHQATIILDDGNRQDEQQIVERWQKNYHPQIQGEFIELEKGAYLIRKTS